MGSRRLVYRKSRQHLVVFRKNTFESPMPRNKQIDVTLPNLHPRSYCASGEKRLHKIKNTRSSWVKPASSHPQYFLSKSIFRSTKVIKHLSRCPNSCRNVIFRLDYDIGLWVIKHHRWVFHCAKIVRSESNCSRSEIYQ